MSKKIVKNDENAHPALFQDVRSLIEQSRSQVAVAVNATLTMLHWNIGKRINEEVRKGERAEYGKQIVSALARQLTSGYGRGFAEKNLRRMMQFARVFLEVEIVATLSRQLSW